MQFRFSSKIKVLCFLFGDPVEGLNAFAMAIDGDQALKDRVSAAESPEEVIQIAQAAGFTINLSELKQAGPDLSSSYWALERPWVSLQGPIFQELTGTS